MGRAEVVGLTKNQIIGELSKSPHGKLDTYVPTFTPAFRQEPEFCAHLIAWNYDKGAIKDSKVALPVLSLQPYSGEDKSVFHQNSLAHLAMLDPREFVRAVQFARTAPTVGQRKVLRRLAEKYIRQREKSFGLWESAFLSHRKSMLWLYGAMHIKSGSKIVSDSLDGKFPEGSTLQIYSRLHLMEPREALGYVLTRKIPFKQAVGALGPKIKNPDVVLALINQMSATELTTNAKMLERYGVKDNTILREAFRAKLREAAESAPKQSLLKASRAAEVVGGEIGKQLHAVQEKQLAKMGGVKGRWGVFGDMSSSMQNAIEATRFIAANIARVAEETHLIFFNTNPWYKPVTGFTLEQIKDVTRHISANGGTSPGCALDYLRARNIEVDGVCVITDGGERHAPEFVAVWRAYCKRFDKEPTLYVFEVDGSDPNWLSQRLEAAGIAHEKFDLRAGVDYHSLPNTIATMNTRRYSLVDQIMDTPLKTLDEVFAQ